MRSVGGRVACGAAVVATLVGLVVVPAAAVGSGSISGRVTDGDGVPISGICVNVENGPSTQTDGLGAYTLSGLDDGSYKLQYSDCNPQPRYVSEWYLGRPDSGSADPVAVTGGVDTPVQDVRLALGVAVSGTATDSNGAPVAGISVNVNPLNPGGQSTGTQTGGDGSYTTSPLPPGDYKVQFSDNGPNPAWARQYWNNQATWNAADTLTLATTDGPVRTGIDAHLTAGATIDGVVTGAGGAPLAGICVNANMASANGWDGIAGTTTGSDGTYTINQLPPTSMRVEFRDCNSPGAYVEQWYDGQSDFNTSTPVVLAAGEDRHGVNAQLSTGVSLAGRVTDPDGNPIAGISVNANPQNSGPSGWAQTDSNGLYTTSAIPPGSYRIQFSASGPHPAWATQYWHAKPSYNTADLLTITAGDGSVHGGVDATLTAAATVAGTVTAPGGAPVANVCVSAEVDTPNGPDQIGNTTTAIDGSYLIEGLPATAVKVHFRDCNFVGPYLEQWWNDKPDPSNADALTLAAGTHTTGIDAHLAAAGAITGTVTDAADNPLPGICAQATTSSFFGGLARTDAHGHYNITLTQPGAYRVQFVDCNQTPAFAGQWWNHQPSASTAAIVSVAPGQVVTGIDTRLTPGAVATISGKVVNLGGTAMTTACVVAYLPNQYALFAPVNPDGTYTVAGVPSGTYALAFLGCPHGGDPTPTIQDHGSAATTYHAIWWNAVPLSLGQNTNQGGPDPIAQGANLITIAPAQHLTGYDWCFGCTAISITHITPGSASLTIAFTTPGLANPVNANDVASAQASTITYTATCTSSTGGTTGSATGSTSPITVTGLTPGATYTCTVSGSDGRTTVAASTVSGTVVVPANTSITVTFPASLGGVLPKTGINSLATLVRIGLTLLGLGIGLMAVTRRRRPEPFHP